MQHTRVIYPVGHGGFAAEFIGDMCVAYDCGSNSNVTYITRSIDNLKNNGVKHIDYLVISHFDKDHVNSIRLLISKIKVVKALVPAIPTDMRIVYNEATNGAYEDMIAMFGENNLEVTPIEDDFTTSHPLWVWTVKSIITHADWAKLASSLQKHKVDITRLNDAAYISSVHADINNSFKAVWGNAGPNAKGLIMLSDKHRDASVKLNTLGYSNYSLGCGNTGCVYLGDACVKTKQMLNFNADFINANISDIRPLLLQIPHHGSKSNMSSSFLAALPSDYYFVCDADNARINKNIYISAINGKPQRKLMFVGVQFQQTIKGYIDVECR